jgi:methionyl-tRNA synthetase
LEKPKRHLITAALPYANGPLHIGHIAGAYLPSDIYTRFLKLKGEDAVLICGSDEHGAAITIRAKKEGVTPQEIVDKYHKINKKAFEDLGIHFDIYHRTSSDIHHETAQAFFKELDAKGSFTKQTNEQYFDETAQQFLADRYIVGTCPKCGFENAYGDQCESCGSTLNPEDLINPKSTLSGEKPVKKTTTHWFLPMDQHETWLKEWVENGTLNNRQHHHPKLWRNQVIGQCKSWIDNGLQPRAMTRDLNWGVRVPVEGGDGKVLYVWLDAPIGYISATKQWALDNGKNWEDYWKDESTEMIHFIGKDNIVFHCIIFPILLKEHGGFNLPTNVPANEFLNLEGGKLSTSRDWAVWVHEYLQDFEGKEDVLRYVLCSIAPETKDSEFTWNDFQARNNGELVAIFGNFINRAIVLTHKYFEGKVPELSTNTEQYNEVYEQLTKTSTNLNEKLETFHFRDAQNEAMAIARLGNKFLADTEPWKLFKTDIEEVKTILHIALQIAANLAIAFEPFLPFTSSKLSKMLRLKEKNWSQLSSTTILKAGHQLNPAELLFEKIDDDMVSAQVQKLADKKAAKAAAEKSTAPAKEPVSFEDFSKLDIRVGKITAAEKVAKTKKLLKLTVETGLDTRTVVSGIAESYSAEEVIGKQVTILINLAPRKIKGIESEGMILMAENKEGSLSFVSPEHENLTGGEVK